VSVKPYPSPYQQRGSGVPSKVAPVLPASLTPSYVPAAASRHRPRTFLPLYFDLMCFNGFGQF
jgi:hypothetical protein